MSDTLFLLLPVPVFFFLGMLLRKSGIIDSNAISFLFRFVASVSLPALSLSIFPYITLNPQAIWLPLIAFAVTVFSLASATAAASLLRLRDPVCMALIMGTVAAHTGFVLPFIKPFFGNEGIALFLLFHGSSLSAARILTRRSVGISPAAHQKRSAGNAMLFAIGVGLVMNFMNFRFEPVIAVVLHDTAQLAIPLLLLASGASVRLPAVQKGALCSGFLIRFAAGAAAGYALATLTGLQEMERSVAILSAAAPAGLLHSPAMQNERSAQDFSEALASVTMIGGLLLLPLLLFTL